MTNDTLAQAKIETASAAIEPMLVLSTAHIAETTCNLFLPEYSGPAWRKGDYGWFVYVVEDDDRDLPTDLVACFTLAREKGAFWIMFDRDAPTLSALPTHDW